MHPVWVNRSQILKYWPMINWPIVSFAVLHGTVSLRWDFSSDHELVNKDLYI